MTFCIAVRVNHGIVALADTRIVKGAERISKSKLSLHNANSGSYFSMTSGLRSIRDKLLIYTEQAIAGQISPPTRLFEIANTMGEQLRKIRVEDCEALTAGNLSFNLHAIIGGRLAGDQQPTLFQIYPEGNWIEINDDSPYFMIGRTPYGRPIMDVYLNVDRSLAEAATLALLAFQSTATCVTDVDYPIDVAIMSKDSFDFVQKRLSQDALQPTIDHWQNGLAQTLLHMPHDWVKSILG